MIIIVQNVDIRGSLEMMSKKTISLVLKTIILSIALFIVAASIYHDPVLFIKEIIIYLVILLISIPVTILIAWLDGDI